MEHILAGFLFILFLVIVISIVNEKTIKIPNDIALVLFAFLFSAIVKICQETGFINFSGTVIKRVQDFNFEEFLMEGILCFMLFAGASGVSFNRFVKNIKSISLLALLTTVLSSFIYGGLFYLLSRALKLGFSIWLCILVGCIVSPTDPIAATSILKKAGLSKNVSTVIEGESLFNDGTGVAVFVCFKNIVNDTSDLSFPVLMAKELLGAIAIAMCISIVMFWLLRHTNNPVLHIFISMFDVMAAYIVCEHLGCSGVIASVVCGIYFSKKMSDLEEWRRVVDPKDWYEDFWHIADTLFNSVLFILIGLALLNMPFHKSIIILIIAAIAGNFISRYAGVFISTLIIGKNKIPNRYSIKEFTTLMTWSALKGGLSLALAFSCGAFLTGDTYNVVLIVTYTTMFFTIVCQGLTTKTIFALVEGMKAKRVSR